MKLQKIHFYLMQILYTSIQKCKKISYLFSPVVFDEYGDCSNPPSVIYSLEVRKSGVQKWKWEDNWERHDLISVHIKTCKLHIHRQICHKCHKDVLQQWLHWRWWDTMTQGRTEKYIYERGNKQSRIPLQLIMSFPELSTS